MQRSGLDSSDVSGEFTAASTVGEVEKNKRGGEVGECEMVCWCLFTLSYDGVYTPHLVDLVGE